MADNRTRDEVVSASVLVVTGETSGEQHMAGVMEAMRSQTPNLEVNFFGSGGPAMERAGAEILQDVSQLAAIGPGQALSKLTGYVRLFRRLLREVRQRKPRLAILVDFPDFNLRLAPRLKKMGVPVCGFISPQIWAWRTSRVGVIRRYFDRILVILPFEEEFYRKFGVEATFVGHPASGLKARSATASGLPRRSEEEPARIAIMPGSRASEIKEILPIQLDAALGLSRRLNCSFWLLQAPGVTYSFLFSLYRQWQEKGNPAIPIEIRHEAAWRLLPHVDCAIIKSGTSTLDAMVLEVPFAMVYRMSNFSYNLLRPWVKIDTFCLANLVAGEKIVPEFVQKRARGIDIADYLHGLLTQPEKLQTVKQNLRIASERLGDKDAYAETAAHIIGLLKDVAVK